MKLTIKEIVLFAILGSILTIGQIAISFLPNIEVVSFLIIIYALIYGNKAVYSVIVFVLLQGIFYGIGPWWFGYLLIWPTLLGLTLLLKKWLKKDILKLSVFSAIFGLIFGALFAVPYVLVGNFTLAITFWLNGLIFDIIHMVGNYFVMFFLGNAVYNVLEKLNIMYFRNERS